MVLSQLGLQFLYLTSFSMSNVWCVRKKNYDSMQCTVYSVSSFKQTAKPLLVLMMKAVSTLKSSVSLYQTTRRNIPEDNHLKDQWALKHCKECNWNVRVLHRSTERRVWVVSIPIFIRDVQNLNLGPGNSCPKVFHGFSETLQANFGIIS
jgi:hypothetical protein